MALAPTHLRAYQGTERIRTAAILQGGSILQVYPTRAEYDTIARWRDSLPLGSTVRATHWKNPEHPIPLPVERSGFPRATERQANEVAEFFGLEGSGLFKETRQLTESAVQVTLQDDSVWVVERDLNFFVPPRVTRNGKRFPNYEWSPSFTALKWLMTLAFTDHPEGARVVPAVADLAAAAKIEPAQQPIQAAQT
jgi:hypothetical protein